MARDPYSVLGVAKNASEKDIKSAFRKQAKTAHPDSNPNDPKAQQRFSEISQAYDILGDAEKRRQYDRGEIDAEGNPKFAGFGGRSGGQAGGFGGFGGRGAGDDPFAAFSRAAGGGRRFDFRSGGTGGGFTDDILSELFGGGGGGAAGFKSARSQGQSRATKGEDVRAILDISIEDVVGGEKVTAQFDDGRRIAVKLPEGVEDGQVIRLKGQGQPSPTGGADGDALITIRFRPHPRYRVEGRDLHVEQPIDLKDAVFGTKLRVDTPQGRIAMTVPAWSSSDKVLRAKGRGLARKKGPAGDLLVHLRIMLPEKDEGLEQFLKQAETL